VRLENETDNQTLRFLHSISTSFYRHQAFVACLPVFIFKKSQGWQRSASGAVLLYMLSIHR
jgi:hypothetical protein